MKQYSRVSYGVRCQIDAFLQVNLSIPEISKRLDFHKTTIYRELKRNSIWGKYTPWKANDRAAKRYKQCRKLYVIKGETERIVVNKIAEGWSPEQISGRLKIECGKAPSHQSIYNYILHHDELKTHLRRPRKRGNGRYIQRKKNKNSGYLSIHNRPRIADQRGRIGDWERDTMHTKDGVQLLVCVDRKTRLTKVGRIDTRTNEEINQLTVNLINSTNRKALTMTNDNGGDFKANRSYGIRTYFCDPFKPQQRGTVENTIGLLRQYIGRKTDVTGLTTNEFEKLEAKINLRPRKILDYQTPYEVYFKKRVALAF